MRLLILSDLHREVWREAPPHAQDLLVGLRSDLDRSLPGAVILAGDIDVGASAIVWADATFPLLPAIYVPANHEAYGRKVDAANESLARECAATGHIHFLDKGELDLDEVRFLGATLWTDFQLLGSEAYQDAL
ncbi:hypothetical protein I5U65_02295 [Stenotrophomonas maltophilia]|nr:hypothetical protein [Stenotrophomonas maltophilia]